MIDGNHRREAEEAPLGFNAQLRVRRAGRSDLVACARVATPTTDEASPQRTVVRTS